LTTEFNAKVNANAVLNFAGGTSDFAKATTDRPALPGARATVHSPRFKFEKERTEFFEYFEMFFRNQNIMSERKINQPEASRLQHSNDQDE
jgi:hypothetical protein